MANIPKKIQTRIIEALKQFQPILASAKSRDLNESDTVVIIADLLSELFGYDKYTEITSEFAIRNTYCDLAVIIQEKVEILIEAKAIGLDLKPEHVKQAVDYAANQGVEWVILTNGDLWKIFRVTFGKPIEKELVFEFEVTSLNSRKASDLEMIFPISREGIKKNKLLEYYEQKQILNRYSLAAVVLEDEIVTHIRRVLRKLSAGAKVTNDEIRDVLQQEVLKREIIENDRTKEHQKGIVRKLAKRSRKKATDSSPVQT